MIIVTSLHRDFMPSSWNNYAATGWDNLVLPVRSTDGPVRRRRVGGRTPSWPEHRSPAMTKSSPRRYACMRLRANSTDPAF